MAQEITLDSTFIKAQELEGFEKINEMNRIAFEAIKTAPNSAISWANEALGAAQNLNFNPGIAQALYTMSVSQRILNQHGYSLKHSIEALSVYTLLEDSLSMAACEKIIALNYDATGFKQSAINHLTRAAMTFASRDKKAEEANARYNLAQLYFDIYRPTQSVSMLNIAWTIFDNLGKSLEKARCDLLAARSYQILDSAEQVIRHYSKAIAGMKETGSQHNLVDALLYRSSFLANSGDELGSKNDLDGALQLSEAIGRRSLIVRSLDSLLVYFSKTENWNDLATTGERAIELSELSNCNECQMLESSLLALAYSKLGLHDKVYKQHETYKRVSDIETAVRIHKEKQELSDGIRGDQLEKEMYESKNSEVVQEENYSWFKKHARLWIFGGILLLSLYVVMLMKKAK